ncbi:MAG: hypothetical protein M1812_003528 [Candelaria pacifica]|nr:MAG: hypothetical protein M1812_003528 [Candelaria pacifica]
MPEQKPIPLDTPTNIELSPGFELRVTLFDANHCTGAVMFLIQGQGKAILYTGDIRSESWWVNALVRNPVLVPYTSGKLRLDKIYLDTTFAVDSDPYRKFPSKAEGLRELLEKISQYPDDTVFHFNAWTLGYEDVWIALSSALESQVHVDRYKMRLYKSIAPLSENGVSCHEGPPLCGFNCERGTVCSALEETKVVSITPIISRLSTGAEFPEIGAGGGAGDLNETHELELDDAGAVGMLLELCTSYVQDPASVAKIISLISTAMATGRQKLSLGALALAAYSDDMPLPDFAELLKSLAEDKEIQGTDNEVKLVSDQGRKRKLSYPASDELPLSITFPYSRHSSYEELCHLLGAFKPGDLYPCTTDEESWHRGVSMRALFGRFCSGTTFSHDRDMEVAMSEPVPAQSRKRQRDAEEPDDYLTAASQSSCGSTESHNFRSTAADNQFTGAPPTTPIDADTDEGKTVMNFLPEHITKKSKHHHQQAPTAESDLPQQHRIDAIARSFTRLSKQTESNVRQSETGKAQDRNSDSTVQGSSPTERGYSGRQANKPLVMQRDSSPTIPRSRQRSPTKPASTASQPTRGSSVNFKKYSCGIIDCSQRFINADSLHRHARERHCMDLTIKGSATLFCPWPICNSYFQSKELWNEHVLEKHFSKELRRVLSQSGDAVSNIESQASFSLPTPPEESHTLSANIGISTSPGQPRSTPYVTRICGEAIEEGNVADEAGLQSSLPESLLFDSQSTIFADEHAERRLQDRNEAYHATLASHNEDQTSLTFVSTVDGHTELDLEL